VFDESDGSDPLGTFVLYGKGARKQTRVFNPVIDEDSCISFSAAVSIPPRSTRYLLFFTEAHDSDDLAGAKADARRYNDRKPAKVLKGLSRAVKRNVLNWDLG
jgi:hypothetical protein